MMERRRLVREEPAIGRRRDRLDDEGPRTRTLGDGAPRAAELMIGRRRRWTRGRPSLASEFADLGRGTVFVGIESAAIALDTAARVLRAAVDRAFDEDYDRPGDVIRGIAGEADLAAYDLATELRGVPRKLARRFDESFSSPRADRGERERREDNGVPDGERRIVRARARRDD